MEVYLDNSATTRVFPEVAELMAKIMCEDYGNPSSLHMKGIQAEQYLRYATRTLARLLKVNERELLFTSGGTESDNLALVGCALANRRRGNHLITTRIEHPAILQTMNYLETQGFRVTYLPVSADGHVRPADLECAMTPETILISVMHTNNEIGAVQPIEQLSAVAKSINPNVLFHVDAVQGFGKAIIYPKRMGIDLMSVSSHKIHGPKGVGLLYINERVKIQPIMFGGGQQQNLRSGTENVPGVAGMAKASELLFSRFSEDISYLYQLKKQFIEGIRQIEDAQINGLMDGDPFGEESAPHIVSVSFRGVRSEVLLHTLEEKGIYVSAGSACSSHKPQPSATLRAIGVEKALLESTVRFSFSTFTTREEIDYTLQVLYDKIPMLRKYMRR